MKTTTLGFPRIGEKRELKKACEAYWKGDINEDELVSTGKKIRYNNWKIQYDSGIDLIPCNDFSFYDQVLDMILSVGCIPERYGVLKDRENVFELYFAMARGVQKNGLDITAMEMTKWFDTNYHYIVPEFVNGQGFSQFSTKITDEYKEAKELGFNTKPVLIGPVSFLLLGKEKEEGFNKIDLLDKLLPVYCTIIEQLRTAGAEHIQIDEPFLALDLNGEIIQGIQKTYQLFASKFPDINIMLATYFDALDSGNINVALQLPVFALHLDLARGPRQLEEVLSSPLLNDKLCLSLGLVDGRNIWKNNLEESLALIFKAKQKIGPDRIFIASSCSLLHSPYSLGLETNETALPTEVKQWMAFARQKLWEITGLKKLSQENPPEKSLQFLEENKQAFVNKAHSELIHHADTKQRLQQLTVAQSNRKSPFNKRSQLQQKVLNLPFFPTTTIGSFPQTKEVRQWRANHKRGGLKTTEYEKLLEEETLKAIRFQEDVGLDVLVHGEFERNDMVEYFGEKLKGFAFTQHGWVQSYGSRCVKPPVIFGDVYRTTPMTVHWSAYAQSLTNKLVKAMLTGPVTILQWSFVRNDQPRETTCKQIALALRDEVENLEKAGLKIIQIDEPALREGLPLKLKNRKSYLEWSVEAFKISASVVKDETQIHTHMCYSEFNDIIEHIAAMDADVITIETSRSARELLKVFVEYNYPNGIGPGVYDIHSPRVPDTGEMVKLLKEASQVLPFDRLWVNPDCGLKTRDWPETREALKNMILAAKEMRENVL